MSLLVLPCMEFNWYEQFGHKNKTTITKKNKICRQIALLVLVRVRVHTLAAFRSEHEDDYEYEF